jgi:hypothetical protein
MKLPCYSAYISMPDEDRERLYQQYCKKNKLDPALEYSVFEFFDTIDKKEENETATDSIDLNIDSL